MSINPKILARMKLPHNGQPDLGMTGEPEPALPHDRHLDCAPLTGAWKQRKWAIDLRNVALDLKWPDAVNKKLRSISDATWWIANRAIVTTMKFKEPSPEQMQSGVPSDAMTPAAGAPQRTPHQKRVDDAMLWAESVSRHPTLAQAAILSCLRFAYPKGEMRNRITAKGRELLAQANVEVNRDTDAIQLMLSKE